MKTLSAFAGRKPRARPPARAPEQTETPPMATTAKMSRLSNISKFWAPPTDGAAPKKPPATPAMAADRTKTISLVMVTDWPRVAQAASESLAATSTRPKGPRRRARMPMENRAKTTARKMVKALGEVTLRPKSTGWGTATEPLKPKMADHGKMVLSMRVAEDMVPRDRKRPRRRTTKRTSRAGNR